MADPCFNLISMIKLWGSFKYTILANIICYIIPSPRPQTISCETSSSSIPMQYLKVNKMQKKPHSLELTTLFWGKPTKQKKKTKETNPLAFCFIPFFVNIPLI